MMLPENWSTVTVTGTYIGVDGEPLSGRVDFQLPVRLIVEDDKLFVLPSSIEATLNESGAFSAVIPASDDPDLSTVFQYRVVERIAGRKPQAHAVTIPHDVETADLADLLNLAAPSAPPDEVVNLDVRYGRKDAENVWSRSQAIGTGVGQSRSLDLVSSFDGGEDDGSGFDSTSRINLESYQRASFASFGEVLRIFSRKANSKQMIAWYGPTEYDENGDPVGNDKPWFWLGAHYEANDGQSVHGHWSFETPDATGALQTRFEVKLWDPVSGAYGLDKTNIQTNQTDFTVRCSNGQVLRLSANNTHDKAIQWSLDHDGRDEFRRWVQRVVATSGHMQFVRYDDNGEFVEVLLHLTRSTGRVGVGTTDPTTKFDLNSNKIRVRQSHTPASASVPGEQGDIAWDADFLYVCVATNTWKRVALETW